MARIIIYGSYGYTGQLIVENIGVHDNDICLAGRNATRLKEQSAATGLPYIVADLSDRTKLDELLMDASIVIHCAGPFIHTAIPMVEACLRTRTHYIDITGEYQVFESIRRLDERARECGIMLLPGAGFDVVPSDCLANYLAAKIPAPEFLTLAFTSSGGGMSRGTSKTMIEGMKDGHVVRKAGKLVSGPLGADTREVDYGPFSHSSVGISWGDISTAFFSTGIPNITVYTATKPAQISRMRKIWRFRAILTAAPVRRWLQKQVDRKPAGPGKKHLEKGESYLFGEVSNKDGQRAEARLTTFNGYRLTSMCVVYITNLVLDGKFKPGYQTPASAYGWELITDITGHQITER